MRFKKHLHKLMLRKTLASSTMLKELQGTTVEEKAVPLQERVVTYLDIRRDPVAASDKLQKPIDFGDLVVHPSHPPTPH